MATSQELHMTEDTANTDPFIDFVDTGDNQSDEPQPEGQETQAEEPQPEGQETQVEEPKPKRKRKRGGPRKTRKPSLKDWIRVIKSTGNGQLNTEIRLRINTATGLCELITNAPKQEGSDEAEGERVQVFRITHYEEINDPDADPLGMNDTPAEEPAAEGEAEAGGEEANTQDSED
jgi:hypothetical protein